MALRLIYVQIQCDTHSISCSFLSVPIRVASQKVTTCSKNLINLTICLSILILLCVALGFKKIWQCCAYPNPFIIQMKLTALLLMMSIGMGCYPWLWIWSLTLLGPYPWCWIWSLTLFGAISMVLNFLFNTVLSVVLCTEYRNLPCLRSCPRYLKNCLPLENQLHCFYWLINSVYLY